MTTVLIANDDASSRDVLRTLFAGAGYVVREATTKEAALAQLRDSAEPLIVMLDFTYARWDGAAVLREAATQPGAARHAYVLMVLRDETITMGFARALSQLHVTVVNKPISLDALLAAVKRAARSIAPTADPGDEQSASRPDQ